MFKDYMELPKRQVKCTPYAFAPTMVYHSDDSENDSDSSNDDDSEYDDIEGDLKPAAKAQIPKSYHPRQLDVNPGKTSYIKYFPRTKTP